MFTNVLLVTIMDIVGSGVSFGRIWLDSLSCTGNESSLLECETDGMIGSTQCTHSQDVGIRCHRKASKHMHSNFI